MKISLRPCLNMLRLQLSFLYNHIRRFELLLTYWVYNYFEKGCRKKCTPQSRNSLWMVFSSLFFKDILKNGKRGHGLMYESAKGKQQN